MSGWLRLGHWLFACCIVLAWFTRHGGGAWHEWFGYAAFALASFRVIQGCVAHGPVRFDRFVHRPNVLLDYLTNLWREPRPSARDGYNPLSAYLACILLGLTVLTGVSGWLHTNDRNWGSTWIGAAHSLLAAALIIVAVLHGVEVVSRSIPKTPP